MQIRFINRCCNELIRLMKRDSSGKDVVRVYSKRASRVKDEENDTLPNVNEDVERI